MPFSQAKAICQSNGAILPEPRTEAMRTLMRQSPDFPDYFWLGLTDIANDGQYVWESDNSIASDIDWEDRYPLEKESYDCVIRGPSGWFNEMCSWTSSIVCQKRE